METESDGINESVEGQLRTGAVVASHIGERVARMAEELRRALEARHLQEAREMESRIAAERDTARAMYANTDRSDWWEKSSPEQVRDVYETAQGWAEHDPEASKTLDRMNDEIRSRYGVEDPREWMGDREGRSAQIPTAGPDKSRDSAEAAGLAGYAVAADAAEKARLAGNQQAIADDLHHGSQTEKTDALGDRGEFNRLRSEAEEVREEETPAADVEADQIDADADVAYDSAERRESTQESLYSQGLSEENVAVRMQADVSQARPAGDAVKTSPARGAQARKGALPGSW